MAVDMKKRNAEFQAMTVEEKRVAVARDAIKLMDSVPELSVCRGEGYLCIRGAERLKDRDLAEWFSLPNAPTCHVCAKGALLMSCVRWRDEMPADVFLGDLRLGDGDAVDYLADVFPARQLHLIEHAFENFGMDTDHGLTRDEMRACNQFKRFSKSPTKRFRAICENIIQNNGTFAPAKTDIPATDGGPK